MNISFSTTCKHEAAVRFGHDKFKWLPQAAKDYVLENLGPLRVQCTMMYEKPQIEFHGDAARSHYDHVIKLLTESK